VRALALVLVSGAGCGWRRREGFSVVREWELSYWGLPEDREGAFWRGNEEGGRLEAG
jgi:hypothetical protein